MTTILLLCVSNVFMTFAWYGHLKFLHDKPLWVTVLISWGIAFFEYALMVPANRLGYGHFSGYQLKIIQEAITLVDLADLPACAVKDLSARDCGAPPRGFSAVVIRPRAPILPPCAATVSYRAVVTACGMSTDSRVRMNMKIS